MADATTMTNMPGTPGAARRRPTTGTGTGTGPGTGPGMATAAPTNIGQAAAATGVTPKMIRHYEALGLLPAVPRSDAGYRRYDARTLHTLRFIRRARDLGFGLDEIASLLARWGDRGRASAEVKALAARHAADLEQRIERMQAMRRTLQNLVGACHCDHRPDCPILDDLAGGGRGDAPPGA
jgi:MerR family transcriptional regulator, copper efflux regulator